MKKVNTKQKLLREFAKRGALDKRWIGIIQKSGYFLQPIPSNKRDFVSAFNSKRTPDSLRMIMIISTFSRDKVFAGRKLKHKSLMNVGIAPGYNRSGKLTHFKLMGMNRAEALAKSGFASFEHIKLEKVDVSSILNTRNNPAVVNTILNLLPDPKDAEITHKMAMWIIECIKHLNNLLWLLSTALKMFDKKEVILYPNSWDRGSKDAYQEDTRRIEFHGFPKDLVHYIDQNELFKQFYIVIELDQENDRMSSQLWYAYEFANSIDKKEYPDEVSAYQQINRLVVIMAECCELVLDLLEKVKDRGTYLKKYKKRFKESILAHAIPIEQKRHKPARQKHKPESTQLTEYNKKLVDRILNGLQEYRSKKANPELNV